MFIKNFTLSFVILFSSFFGFSAWAETKSEPKNLTTKDYAVLLGTFRSAGTYARLAKLSGNSAADWKAIKASFGINENTEIPKVSLEGNFIKFEGLNKKLDLTYLHKGEVFDGYKLFRFKSKTFSVAEAQKFISFMTEEAAAHSSKSNLPGLFLPSAQAGEPARMSGAAMAGAGAYVAVLAVQGAQGVAALAAAGSVGAAAFSVGTVVVMASAADTLVKAGIRNFKGNEVICKEGQLYLKTKTEEILIENSTGGTMKKVIAAFGHAEIGAAELATRRLMCIEPKELKILNSRMKQLDESEVADSGVTVPASGFKKVKTTQ